MFGKTLKTVLTASAVTAGFAMAGSAMAATNLNGAGATFPQELYKRWVSEYQVIHPDVKIDYQGIGSGGGIKAITDKTVDFCGSDAPMNKSEIAKAGGADNLIEIPSCAGGVVPAYNVPGVDSDLHFTGKVLADIYMGLITKWNDPAITALNPGINLPATTITPAYRTDGSGTTYVWTNYLCTQSVDFMNTVGMGKQVKWPLGQGGKGNPGVTQVVQQTVGAIGYIEQGYADANHILYGAVQNKNGKFLKASPSSVSMAGAGAVGDMKGNMLAANIWDQPGDEAYPAASFTYLIVYKDLHNVKSQEQAQALVDFLWWAIHDGQKFGAELDFAPLAPAVQEKVAAVIKTITYKSKVLTPRTEW